jgi:hypothetical protein
MSYNGSGTFQINTSGQPVVTGTVISSSAFNALTADLATGLSTAITKDGQTATTVRIPFAAGINSSLTTDTSSGSTGSIFTAGGVGIAKALYVGTNATVVGTLGVTGAATFSATPVFSALTASSAVATDASKNLVSVTNTGTGNNVLATSPTITTPTISQLTSAAATALTLQSAGTTAVTVDTSQNVGIGTTSPSGRLHVTATAGSQTDAYFGNQTTGATTNLRIQSASSNDGYVFFERSGASENGYIRYSQASDFMSFQTASAERMRIDTSGNLLVGTTSSFSGGNVLGVMAQASGLPSLGLNRTTSTGPIARFYYASSEVGNISTNGSNCTFNSTSDYRLKEDILPMTGALAKVALLKPVTYKWKLTGIQDEGFIAHELAEVVPNCVTGNKDAVETYTDEDGNETARPVYQGIDTSFLVATLTAAIQEQQALIISLTDRIVALEAK